MCESERVKERETEVGMESVCVCKGQRVRRGERESKIISHIIHVSHIHNNA